MTELLAEEELVGGAMGAWAEVEADRKAVVGRKEEWGEVDPSALLLLQGAGPR